MEKIISKCSKCGSKEILGPNPLFDAKLGLGKYRVQRAMIHGFICLKCSFVEFYIDKKTNLRIKDLLAKGIIEKE
jgi:hypothetical protein